MPSGITSGSVSYTHLEVYKRQVYGYPKEAAAQIAIDEVAKFLTKHPSFHKIYFVAFDKATEQIYQKLITELANSEKEG